MPTRKRKPSLKAAEAPAKKRGRPKLNSSKKAVAGNASRRGGPVSRQVSLLEDLAGRDLGDDEIAPTQENTGRSALSAEPNTARGPKPVVLLLHTMYEKQLVTDDSQIWDEINDFGYHTYRGKQLQLMAQIGNCNGRNHKLASSMALLSHSKSKKEPIKVDLLRSDGWDTVLQLCAYYHSAGKTELEIKLSMLFIRKKQTGRANSESEDVSPERLAPKKQKSQEVTPTVRKQLDAAAAIWDPGEPNSEFLKLMGELRAKWKCTNKRCKNLDGTCAIFSGQTHSTLLLEDLRLWVKAIQAKNATINAAPHSLSGKKSGLIEQEKLLKKGLKPEPAGAGLGGSPGLQAQAAYAESYPPLPYAFGPE
ncbi:MAG: hypothetical protein M1829_000700 [Trizodia sp. TS-e1964]|nr:MAG: hypothetical protein M1829_000700 [Trizodia sp. TS-e1964]